MPDEPVRGSFAEMEQRMRDELPTEELARLARQAPAFYDRYVRVYDAVYGPEPLGYTEKQYGAWEGQDPRTFLPDLDYSSTTDAQLDQWYVDCVMADGGGLPVHTWHMTPEGVWCRADPGRYGYGSWRLTLTPEEEAYMSGTTMLGQTRIRSR